MNPPASVNGFLGQYHETVTHRSVIFWQTPAIESMSTPETDAKNMQQPTRREEPQHNFFESLEGVAADFAKDSQGPIQWYEDLLRGILPLGDYEKFSTYEALKTARHDGQAWIVVHRGYLGTRPFVRLTNAEYDPATYRQYMKNTTDLLQALKQSGKPTFQAIENQDFQKLGAKKDRVGSLTMSIITLDGAGNIKRFVYLAEGEVVEQDIPLLKKQLKAMGVHTINFAGELGYKSMFGDSWTQSVRCLHKVAQEFADEFKIKGVKGAIYPPEPPAAALEDPIWRQLYFDQVPIPKVPAASPPPPVVVPQVPVKAPAPAAGRAP